MHDLKFMHRCLFVVLKSGVLCLLVSLVQVSSVHFTVKTLKFLRLNNLHSEGKFLCWVDGGSQYPN
jgi:hypothetical protein